MLCHVTFSLMFSVFMFVSRCFLLIINIPVKCEKVNGILIRSLEGFRRSVSQWLLIHAPRSHITYHQINNIIQQILFHLSHLKTQTNTARESPAPIFWWWRIWIPVKPLWNHWSRSGDYLVITPGESSVPLWVSTAFPCLCTYEASSIT